MFQPPYSGLLQWQIIQICRHQPINTDEKLSFIAGVVHMHSSLIEGGECVGVDQLVVNGFLLMEWGCYSVCSRILGCISVGDSDGNQVCRLHRKSGTYGILSHSLETMSWILRVAANDSDIYIIKVCPAKANPLANYTYPGNSGLPQCLGSHADIKLMWLKVTLHTNWAIQLSWQSNHRRVVHFM